MKTEKIITLDLAARGAATQIGEAAVAGDYGSRYLVFALTQEGEPWIVPENVRAALVFRTEAGSSGEYDTLPDGSDAFRVEGNLVTVGLIDQILAKAGWVRLMLVLRRDLAGQLSTFPVLMTVTEPVGGGEALPGRYYRVRNLEEINAELSRIDYELYQLHTGDSNAVVQHNLSGYAHEDIRLRIEKLTTGKLDADKLPGAVEDALSQAAASGEFDGADGRGIRTIARTSGNGAAGTVDTYTITYTDDTTSTYQVRNGANGAQGPQGEKGQDGKTPVKGVDYYTAADKTEMVAAVLAALPAWTGGAY